jgi:histidine ammonia-lyase
MKPTVSILDLYTDLDQRCRALKDDPAAVIRSRAVVEAALKRDQAIYGVNTGFGVLASKRIDADQLGQLQRNLLLSHACGTGDPVPVDISRLMLKLKIHALGLGQSGISMPVFSNCWPFAEHDIVPFIPSSRQCRGLG